MGLPEAVYGSLAMIASAALPVLLLAASPDYASLRGSAEPVTNLGRFLEQYLGDCEGSDPAFDKKGCELEAAKRHYVSPTSPL